MLFDDFSSLNSTEKGLLSQWFLCFLLQQRSWVLLDYNFIFVWEGKILGEIDLVMQRPKENIQDHSSFVAQKEDLFVFSQEEKQKAWNKLKNFRKNILTNRCKKFSKENDKNTFMYSLPKEIFHKTCFNPEGGELVFIESKYRQKKFLQHGLLTFPILSLKQKNSLKHTIHYFLHVKNIPQNYPLCFKLFFLSKMEINCYSFISFEEI